jgi:hypothetical protein
LKLWNKLKIDAAYPRKLKPYIELRLQKRKDKNILLLKDVNIAIRNCHYTCCLVWVSPLICHTEGTIHTKDVGEQIAEKNVWY